MCKVIFAINSKRVECGSAKVTIASRAPSGSWHSWRAAGWQRLPFPPWVCDPHLCSHPLGGLILRPAWVWTVLSGWDKASSQNLEDEQDGQDSSAVP